MGDGSGPWDRLGPTHLTFSILVRAQPPCASIRSGCEQGRLPPRIGAMEQIRTGDGIAGIQSDDLADIGM
jgi:hypothetical protein